MYFVADKIFSRLQTYLAMLGNKTMELKSRIGKHSAANATLVILVSKDYREGIWPHSLLHYGSTYLVILLRW